VLFKPLTLAEIEQIVGLQITDVSSRLQDRHLTLELTDAARELIAREGFDPVYGARPLRRYIQRHVETRIARALLAREVQEGATIVVDAEGDELAIRFRSPAEAEQTADVAGAVA
jgi:ATP-dependent Clp protease ATP-binding subunit ClpB